MFIFHGDFKVSLSAKKGKALFLHFVPMPNQNTHTDEYLDLEIRTRPRFSAQLASDCSAESALT